MGKNRKVISFFLVIFSTLTVIFAGGCGGDAEENSEENMSLIKEIGKDYKILWLTDTQIIDPTQMAYPSRLTAAEKEKWADRESNCMVYVRSLIEDSSPDYIVLTGDNVYGCFDNDGSNWKALVDLIDGYGIPWSFVFGNHDGETYDLTDPMGAARAWGKGYDWQMRYVEENTKHCLFKRGKEGLDSSCHGNYAVNLKEDGKTVYTFFFFDTHDGVTEQYGLTQNQVEWYADTVREISRERYGKSDLSSGVVPSIVFQHIPTYQHYLASLDYTQMGQGIISKGTDILANGDWGQLLDKVTYNSVAYKTYSAYLWNAVQELGSTRAICVGHYHTNAMRINYRGESDEHAVQLCFGVKSSTYDYYYQLGGTIIIVKDEKTDPIITPVYLDGSGNLD